jgi:hypothetical protein
LARTRAIPETEERRRTACPSVVRSAPSSPELAVAVHIIAKSVPSTEERRPGERT